MASKDESARLGGGAQQGARLGGGAQQGARLGGGAQQGASGPSKKKQKDRANQESREAKRAAAAGVVIGGNGDAKKDVFVDWKQSSSEVTVRLRCGEDVQRPSDVHTSFTDTHCHARFPDGCQWSCRLQEEIEGSCSRVQYKEKGNFLLLVMHKKIPFHTWPCLMSNKKEKETVTTETKNGKEVDVGVKKTEKAVKETTEKVKRPSLPPPPPSSSSPPPAQLPPAQLPRAQLPPAQLPRAQLPPAQLPRAKADRGMKRTMKPRPAGEAGGRQGEAGGRQGEAGGRQAEGGARPAGRKGEKEQKEPSPKRTVKHTSTADTHTSTADTHTSPAASDTHTSPAASDTHTSPADTHTSPATNGMVCDAEREGPGSRQQSGPVRKPRQSQEEEPELRVRNVDAKISQSAGSVTDGERLQAESSSNRSVPSAAAGRLSEAQPQGEPREHPGRVDSSLGLLSQEEPGSLQHSTGAACDSSPAQDPSLGPAQDPEPSLGPAQDPAPSLASSPAPASGLRQHGPEKEEEEKKDLSKEESLETQEDAPEPMVNLQLVKNDSYEKGTDLMVVNVYMKNICRESARVIFREQDFTLIFQTSDANFLRLHPDCGVNTVFKWQVKLRNLIQPEQCSYAFTPSRLDITLKKRHSQRWGGLEASSTQVGGAKVAVGSSPSTLENPPAGKGNPLSLPAQPEGPRLGEDKPAAPRAPEDGGLDMVGPRSVSEHSTLKQETPVTMPKPTCMVQPMTHTPPVPGEANEDEEERKVCLPGFTGLVNLGNTCFMNSVIQSLSNTRELRDYFHDRAFEREINCSNPLGTGGRLAIGFAVLLRALWKGTHHAFQPSRLKAIVASKASQFTGYAQHDAQEFMAFLLDGLHEDLNRIQNKPYTETVDSDGRLDEVVADEAWQRHKMRNDSFIVDLFQGQYKSKLVCPMCSKVSITFDPFLYLPVPLPQKQKVLTVFYFSKEPHKKPIKFLVSVSKENSSTAEVLESISRSVRVKPENLRLAEVVRSRLQRVFLSSHSLDSVSSSDMLFCFEVLSKELAQERVLVLRVHQRPQVPSTPISKCAACLKPPVSEEDKLKRCMRCYRVGYCNQVCQKNHWSNHKLMCRPNTETVGLPFLVSVPQSRLTYARLAQLLEGFSRFSVNVFQPPFQSGRLSPEGSQSPVPTGLEAGEEAEDGAQGVSSKPPQASATPAGDTDSSLSSTSDSGYSEPPPPPSSSSQDTQAEKETSCEKAVRPEAAVTGYQQPMEAASGYTCQFYISLLDTNNKDIPLEEKGDAVLDIPDDSCLELVWKNNERVKEFVLVRSKELDYLDDPSSASDTARAGHFTLGQCLSLFTKPEVLAPEEAWYCPKCQQHREASKQLLLWRLPNVLIIQLKRFSFRSFIWRDKINDMVDFPVRNLDLSKSCIGQKDDLQQHPVYDLYAVINHYGGMIGGHYTAYARLPSDKNSQRSDVGWRLFDDSTVTTVEESQVVTRYAYVLFYRRRNSPVERPSRPPGAEPPAAAAASQAALIWQEVEEEEEGPGRGLFSALRRRGGARRREEEGPQGAGPQGAGLHRRPQPRISDYSDDDCVRYFVLGTLAALFALLLNLLFNLLGRHG